VNLALFAALACVADPPSSEAECVSGRTQVVAGVPGVGGRHEDGLPATETWLSLPQDVAIGHDGSWWIADYNNHLLREVDREGIARVVAGTGFPGGGEGGPALAEPLDHPTMALQDPTDPDLLWFAATGNHRIGRLRRSEQWLDLPYGTGAPGFSGDGGLASEATLWRPSSLAFDDEGVMYVSDRMNQIVRSIALDGTITTVVGTAGVEGYSGDGGPASLATLSAPEGTEMDPGNRLDVRGDRLIVADSGNDAIRIVDLGSGVIDTLAGPETGLAAPHDVAIAADGSVWVADTGSHCVRRILPDGTIEEEVGRCGVSGLATLDVATVDATFTSPVGVAVDAHGALWITDRDLHVVRRACP
jgi:streptogramin lyase